MTENESNIPIGIIGNGKVGGVLARTFVNAGYVVECVVAIDPESDKPAPKIRIIRSLEELPSGIKFLLVCVPDGEIKRVVESLLKLKKIGKGMIVGHSAGSESAEILADLRHNGASVLTWHPMQTFTGVEGAELLKGVTIGIDGDDVAVEFGKELAERIGAVHYIVPPEMRSLYHLGGVFACNFMSALTSISVDLLTDSGMDRDLAFRTLIPLIERTVQNINQKGLPESITGPVSRGDYETIAKHERVLADYPQSLETYRLLSGVLRDCLTRSEK